MAFLVIFGGCPGKYLLISWDETVMDPLVQELKRLAQADLPYPGNFSGRGIVISAGGPYLPSAYIAVRSLRHFGNQLPIQIWHLGPQELPKKICPPFEKHGATFVDSFEVRKIHTVKILGGWENKPFSILHSAFEEVLFIDADNMVLKDPGFLFEDELYKKTGNIIWPDFQVTGSERWAIKADAWPMLGLEPRPGSEAESGQILFNKRKVYKQLRLTMLMNSHSDYFYPRIGFGDKDTFPIAFFLCNEQPNYIRHRPKMTIEPVRIQFAPDGTELFQHSRKWGFPASNNPTLPGFMLEKLCLSWLVELEQALK